MNTFKDSKKPATVGDLWPELIEQEQQFLVFLCLILLLPLAFNSETLVKSFVTDSSPKVSQIREVNPEPSIPVNSIEDFEISDDSQFPLYAVSGSGLELDPWIIRDIYVYDPTADIGIWIHDTTEYFQLRNVTVNANRYDVLIEDVAPDTPYIKNCTFELSAWGIGIVNTADAYISECIAYDSVSAGFHLDNATDALLTYNKAYNCDRGYQVESSLSADFFWCESYDASYDSGFYVARFIDDDLFELAAGFTGIADP